MKKILLTTSIVGAALTGLAGAGFDADITPPYRGLADSEFSGWEKMTVAFGGPNVPDEPGTNSDDATLTQNTPGAVLTSTCNIYNPGGTSTFTVSDSVPADLQQVSLQVRTLGSPLLPSASLTYSTGAGSATVASDSVITLEDGDALELLFYWDLSDNPDVITAYTLDFAASAPNSSLDAVLVDTNFASPVYGTSFCTATPNSTGSAASIRAVGSDVVARNEFGLLAGNLPPGVPGLFFYGDARTQTPFGDGFSCAGGSVQRLYPVDSANGLGELERPLDLTSLPLGPNAVPGAELHFQLWYRDPLGPGGTGFNLTDGVSVLFK